MSFLCEEKKSCGIWITFFIGAFFIKLFKKQNVYFQFFIFLGYVLLIWWSLPNSIFFLNFVLPHVFVNLMFVDFSCISVATSTLLTWAMLRRQPQRLLFWVLGLWRPNWRVLKWVLQLRTVAATVDQAAPVTHATASKVKMYNLEAEIAVIYVSTNNKNYVLCLIKWSWLEFANSNVLGYLLRVFEVWLLSVWLVYHKYVNLNHQSLLINGLLLVLYE